jgi:hypothetical protein
MAYGNYKLLFRNRGPSRLWAGVFAEVLPACAQLTQQGGNLVGTGAVGNPAQGLSVALSADGTMAIEGGPTDNSSTGAG